MYIKVHPRRPRSSVPGRSSRDAAAPGRRARARAGPGALGGGPGAGGASPRRWDLRSPTSDDRIRTASTARELVAGAVLMSLGLVQVVVLVSVRTEKQR